MKRIKKVIIGVVVGLVVILGAAFIWIDHVAEAAVEAGATYALGVDTSLEAMDIGVMSGSVEMDGLRISNPKGFDTPHFMLLDNGRVEVTLGSLLQDQVVLPELKLSGISMNLEKKGGRSNYKLILENLQRFESQEDTPKDEAAGGKQFIVQKVSITNVSVQVDILPLGGQLTRVPLTIERIELENIGTDTGEGAGLAQIINTITQAILSSVVKAGGGLIPADVAGELSAGLGALGALGGASVEILGDVTTAVGGEAKRIMDAGTGAVQDLGEGAKGVTGDLEEAGKKIGQGLGGIFAPKDKKKE